MIRVWTEAKRMRVETLRKHLNIELLQKLWKIEKNGWEQKIDAYLYPGGVPQGVVYPMAVQFNNMAQHLGQNNNDDDGAALYNIGDGLIGQPTQIQQTQQQPLPPPQPQTDPVMGLDEQVENAQMDE